MRFTKFLALALVALMMLSVLAACNDGTEETTTDAGTNAPTEDTTEQPTEDTTDADTEDNTDGSTAADTDAPGEDSSEETSAPDEPAITTITIAQALELCGAEGNITTERYYIRATVVSITNAAYGAMIIADETGEIPVYGTYSADGEINYSAMEDKPYRGDEVLLHCILQNYNGTKEVKNARLIEFTHVEADIDLNEYTDLSAADAREADKGTKIKLDGVVARITFANGYKPNGFFLVDDTAAIYVFDNNIAQRVSEGDKITIAGEKDYWILDTEQSNAATFGYKGSCQIANATLIDQDSSQDYAYDKSWITETCIKDLLETPVTENITTNIYKVTALVQKKPGNGFTNYYFYDLDGKTGNYTYTQCNGGDFEWLDAFDGKICTVYISPLNCKSTNSDCFFRLVPIEVIDEGFTFDTANTPAHVLKYYAMDQFGTEYAADPALELVTSVSSELLGFTGATVSYASSDDKVLSFVTADGKTVMHCKNPGTVTVTVTATYGELTATDTVEITVNVTPSIDADNVKTAIDASVGETVTIKGIVGPSLVNKTGFYLIDETGVIAVQTTADVMATLQIGNEVVVQGTRDVKTKGGTTYFGQSNIYDATVLINYYGNHEYSTKTFVTDKTLAEVVALDLLVDYTTTVFVFKATVVLEETAYYSNIFLSDGNGTKLLLYSSSAKQYSWLNAYEGQEITVEVAPCNWNDKKDCYRGCVLAVVTEDGKICNELNFTK